MAEITESKNFIHAFIEEDIAPGGQFAGKTVHTRFPPEPNGYLHIGHCKALIIDFGTAEKFGGICNLRMDDTNPTKEDVEFVEAIQEDIHWLGFDWGDRVFYGSDYERVFSVRELAIFHALEEVKRLLHGHMLCLCTVGQRLAHHLCKPQGTFFVPGVSIV